MRLPDVKARRAMGDLRTLRAPELGDVCYERQDEVTCGTMDVSNDEGDVPHRGLKTETRALRK